MSGISEASSMRLINEFKELQKEVDDYLDIKVYNDSAAVEKATTLAKTAAEYRRELCRCEDGITFKQTLKEKEIPLHIAYKIIEVLNRPALHCKDALQRELSTITQIFFELVICQFIVQKRSFCESEHKRLYDLFKERIKALPEKEVLTRYELRCCRAALKNFASISERLKFVLRNSISAIFASAISTMQTASANPPYVNPAAFLVGTVSILKVAHSQKKEWWYMKVLDLKMLGLEVKLTSYDSYTEKLKKDLKKCSSDADSAFYICQLFNEIINSDNAEERLKEELIFSEDGISLIYLADRESIGKKSKFWQVRYQAIKYLKKLFEQGRIIPGEPRKALIDVLMKLKTSIREKERIQRSANKFLNVIRLSSWDEWKKIEMEKEKIRHFLRLNDLFQNLSRETIEEYQNQLIELNQAGNIQDKTIQSTKEPNKKIKRRFNSAKASSDEEDRKNKIEELEQWFENIEEYYYLKELIEIKKIDIGPLENET